MDSLRDMTFLAIAEQTELLRDQVEEVVVSTFDRIECTLGTIRVFLTQDPPDIESALEFVEDLISEVE